MKELIQDLIAVHNSAKSDQSRLLNLEAECERLRATYAALVDKFRQQEEEAARTMDMLASRNALVAKEMGLHTAYAQSLQQLSRESDSDWLHSFLQAARIRLTLVGVQKPTASLKHSSQTQMQESVHCMFSFKKSRLKGAILLACLLVNARLILQPKHVSSSKWSVCIPRRCRT